MEFVVVLSVNGSLASYQVFRESEDAFHAKLRKMGEVRTDIPESISISKGENGWISEPEHEIISPSIISAIDPKPA